MLKPHGILETSVYCDDLDAAERFYRTLLGLEEIRRQEGRHIFFRCGAGVLLLFNPAATREESSEIDGTPVPRHGARGPGHVAFSVAEGEIAGWKERLATLGIDVEAEIRWPAGGHSLYIRDPAGNSVELATPKLWGLADPSSWNDAGHRAG